MTRIFIFFFAIYSILYFYAQRLYDLLRFDSLKSPLPLSFRRLQGDRVLYMVWSSYLRNRLIFLYRNQGINWIIENERKEGGQKMKWKSVNRDAVTRQIGSKRKRIWIVVSFWYFNRVEEIFIFNLLETIIRIENNYTYYFILFFCLLDWK